jgi:hypothetical protein
VLGQIRNDPKYLALEIVQPLRVQPDARAGLAGSTVSAGNIEDAPIRVPWPGCWVEDQIAQRMNARVELCSQQFPGSSFERRV